MKKISKLLIALFMIVTMPKINITRVSATEGDSFEENGYTYTVLTEDGSTGTVEISGYDNMLQTYDLVIDDTVIYNGITYTVVSIGDSAFAYYELTSVTIPDSVITIGEYAFQSNRLTRLTIGNSVTTIDTSAFEGNRLTSVTIPDSVTTIGDSAFAYNNRLESLMIGSGVTTIGERAFVESGLTSVTIPDNVIIIDQYAFFSNNELTSVTIGNGVTTIGDYAFYTNKIESVTIGDGVITIGEGAFSDNQLTSVTIPDSVITIGAYAFSINQLTSVTIGNSVITIDAYAFDNNLLTSVTIPDNVITIGENAFTSNQLTSVTIGNGVTTIQSAAFLYNLLESVTIPDNVTTIGENAFGYNQLTSVTIGDGITTIEATTFARNRLTSVTIPEGITSIGGGAFGYNQLTSVTIPEGVTTIDEYAFENNQLTSVTIPDSVTRIGIMAFAGNDITTVTIGSGVTSIEKYAFSGNELATIYLTNDSQLSLLSNDNLSASPSAFFGYLPVGIVEIYVPRLETASYQDTSAITKNIGETFEIQVNSTIIYQQIERFDGQAESFIGVDPNATTQPCELAIPSTTYQWYKDGVIIEGATNPIYSEVGQLTGTYQYHVIVNDIVLDEIMVTINANADVITEGEGYTILANNLVMNIEQVAAILDTTELIGLSNAEAIKRVDMSAGTVALDETDLTVAVGEYTATFSVIEESNTKVAIMINVVDKDEIVEGDNYFIGANHIQMKSSEATTITNEQLIALTQAEAWLRKDMTNATVEVVSHTVTGEPGTYTVTFRVVEEPETEVTVNVVVVPLE